MKTSVFFNKINNWNDFNNALILLNNKEKGDAFELLTKLYFLIDHKYDNYDNIWLLSEVPKKELEIIGLESRDLGIDLIAKKGNEYHAIQCKYHSDKNQNVTFREVSTFISLLGGYDKLTEGYICSSAVSTSKNYDDVKKKHISKLLADTWNKLDKDFFDRVRKYLNKESYNPIPYFPRPHQENATNEAYNHFIKNKESRGKLIFPCGAGKSLTGFWMMEKLDSMSTVIAVPSLSLIKQTLDVYLKEIVARGIKVNWLCICSDEGIGDNSEIRFKTDDIGVPCKTDPEYIKNWLLENKDTRNVIFTTYQSSRLIATISKELNHTFDLGILDEAHKTVGGNDKLFSHLLFEENISIRSRIFMTATERFYSGSKDNIVSMDDNDIYGDIFAQMSFKEAIDLELLTDYKIITIDIKKSEISEFIKDNGLVELNSVWKKETEARSLASMLALRKAMKQFPIKNAVSFHSSIAKAQRNKELHTHITSNYGYEPIDTYTVSGKDKTSVRNDIIQEFASSKKALITNARCLTEGVDVPNIDCIVFADPRKSKVDIVQALGRALRKKEGKDWGYVILPVIYDGDTNEIDNDNFNEILSIVRGLAANDERIIEYFKDKSLGKGKERNGGDEVFTIISDTLSESDFAEQLNIRIWEKLSRFNYESFEKARTFVHSLKIKNQREWNEYCESGQKPENIPRNGYLVYENKGWISLGDWLGTNIISPQNMVFLDYEIARDFVNKLNLKNVKEWKEYCRSKLKPQEIPSNPLLVYKDKGWNGFGDWLGNKQMRKNSFISFNEAKVLIKKLNIKSNKEYLDFYESNTENLGLPKTLNHVYKNNGWKGYVDFFGIEKRLCFSEAKKIILNNCNSARKWKEFRKLKNITNIPATLNLYEEYNSKTFWANSNKLNQYSNKWPTYNEAKKIIKKLGVSSRQDYLKIRLKHKKYYLPIKPNIAYENWEKSGGWADFLGKL
ncbi:DEAD/DEAH box helicase family protein [Flavobacteriaceae bacterium]|nr:DEAD/DEAH box helicase family protein [Flavobacteriaceae bacterium]